MTKSPPAVIGATQYLHSCGAGRHSCAVESLPPEAPRSVWLSQGRAELLRLLDELGPSELREVSIELTEFVSEDEPAIAEWARLQAVAAARVGRATAPMTVRSFDGKAERVLRFLRSRPSAEARRQEILRVLQGPDSSSKSFDDSLVSHILRDLEDATLIERSRIGRQTVVALTKFGRQYSDSLEPVVPAPRHDVLPQVPKLALDIDTKSLDLHGSRSAGLAMLLESYEQLRVADVRTKPRQDIDLKVIA